MKKLRNKISALVLCCVLISGVLGISGGFIKVSAKAANADSDELSKAQYYNSIIETETKAIENCAFSNGAIAMYAPAVSSYSAYSMPKVNGIEPAEYTSWKSGKVTPYFSDTAVLGLIKAAKVTRDYKSKDVCLNYINWYLSHMNRAESDVNGVSGTVYDYFIFESDDGKTVEVTAYDANSENYPTDNPFDYDSTDSYASLFLQILYEYANTFDSTFLNDKKAAVDSLINVIKSTYVSKINLTYAKPTYAVCYLMDNCEVFCGFESAEKIYREFLNDNESADSCRFLAEKVKSAITGCMWNSFGKMFLPSVGTNGRSASVVKLNTFYPDGACQLFPVVFNVITPDNKKAVSTYERFKKDFCQNGVYGKDWSAFDISGEHYPWCILARAAAAMEDYDLANRFIDAIYDKFVISEHTDPFYCAESGHLLLAVCELYNALYPQTESELAIRNMAKYNNKSVDYKSTITFYFTSENSGSVEWKVSGADYTVNTDGSCTVKQAKSDFTIYCQVEDDNSKILKSETETVRVKHEFLDKLTAFFKGLFGSLPKITQ